MGVSFVIWLAVCLSLAIVNFAESSITSLSGARLKGLRAVLGKPFGDAAARWLNHPEEYLTLLLLVQTILESFYAWLLVAWLAFWVTNPGHRQLLAWSAGTVIALVFLTLYPKLLARKLSHGIMGAWILRLLYLAVAPLYPVLRLFFKALNHISGGGQTAAGALGRGMVFSLEEIRELFDLSHTATPASTPAALRMMANYLRLKEVRIEEIMTPREKVSAIEKGMISTTAPATPQKERALFHLMTDGHTRTIVLENGFPVGYLHAKDLLKEAIQNPAPGSVDILKVLRSIPAVYANQTALGAVPLLLRQTPIVYVVKDNEWVGILTTEDILEEVTGEIVDEFEHRKKRFPMRQGGKVR